MNTYKALFKSGFEGVISEVGLGVPLQADLLSQPGASEFLLMGLTPYNHEFQPKINDRSVSERMVIKMAEIAFNQAKAHKFPRSGKRLFSMAVSGTHVNPAKAKGAQSHAWVCLMTEAEIRVVHVRIMHTTRKRAIHLMRNFTRQMLLNGLMGGLPVAKDFGLYMDVIRWPNMSLIDKLHVTKESTIYIDADGKMQRAADVIRKATHIYRGSFNPPTNIHLEIGGNALFEICRVNSRKGEVDVEDLAHRVRMLNTLGKGVLITYEASHFVHFHRQLTEGCGMSHDVQYLMGADTFNRIATDIESGGFEHELPNLKSMKLVVNDRTVSLHKLSENLPNLTRLSRHNEFSSTKARAGDHSGVPPAISDYIRKNKLYQSQGIIV